MEICERVERVTFCKVTDKVIVKVNRTSTTVEEKRRRRKIRQQFQGRLKKPGGFNFALDLFRIKQSSLKRITDVICDF